MSKVMIVDDEPDIRFAVGKILEKEGYDIMDARDGPDCLKKIRKDKPDLVLLDVMMPGMDGWEVLNEIQSDDDLKSISVTMFTVKPLTPETLQKKGVEGLVDYIVKPFSKKSFLDSIRDIFSTMSRIEDTKDKLIAIDKDLADRYEKLLKANKLHRNLKTALQNVLRQRKEDGSMDDIQSFEDVIISETKLIESYREEIKEIEDKIKQQ
ncbi:MAG: PleD family two-component system response regulator [Candidatus Hydrothermarchaeales archaeon]